MALSGGAVALGGLGGGSQASLSEKELFNSMEYALHLKDIRIHG